MNNFKTQLELLLIAYLDSGTVTEQVARNLNESEDFDDLEGRLISYLDSDMITEEFGHNLINATETL